MVKPKGQHGKGKLISADSIIKDIEKKAEGNPQKVKEEGKKKLQELKEEQKGAKSMKEKNKIKRRMENLKAYIKLFGRYSSRSPILFTPFTKEQMDRIVRFGPNVPEDI